MSNDPLPLETPPAAPATTAVPVAAGSNRLSRSPWWPVVVWLGLPLVLINLSWFSWPRIGFELVIRATSFSFTPNVPLPWWFELPSVALFAMFCLVLVQAVLFSQLLAWGPGRFWPRLATYVCVTSVALACLLASIPLAEWAVYVVHWWDDPSSPFSHDSFTATSNSLRDFASVPTLLLGFQVPFWLSRIFFRWRLVHTPGLEAEVTAGERESLSISDLFLATAIVAVCLGLLQLQTPQENATGQTFASLAGSQLLATLIIAIIVALVAIPLANLFLRNISGCLAWLISGAATIVISLAIAGSLAIFAPGGATYPRLILLVANWTIVLWLGYAGSLSLLRWYGWRLTSRKAHSLATT